MNSQTENDSLMAKKVDAAIRQAAYKVIQRAKETGTPVIIWEDDQIKEIPADEMEMRMNAAYPKESTP